MLKMGNPTMDQDQIDGSFADDLVGDVNVTALGVPCLRAHRISPYLFAGQGGLQ
jgi:hypothetical protein